MTSYPCNKYEQITPSYLLSVNQALEMPILSRCIILDILQQQQCKFFLRQHHIFTQRADVDVKDEIDHFFQLERLFALEDEHFVFLYV